MNQNNFNIRLAEPVEADYKLLLQLGAEFAREHTMGKLSISVNCNAEKVLNWIVQHVAYATFIAEVDGQSVGTIALRQDSTWYSDDLHITDGWFYVLPNYRKSGVGVALLEAAKKFAEDKGLPLLIGVFNMGNALQTCQMLERHGFKMAGGLFLSGE
jgi:GNAT superfamily N-acetyltransferase